MLLSDLSDKDINKRVVDFESRKGITGKKMKVNPKSSVRSELVEKYRKQIAEKRYKIKSREIADKMAKDIFDTKNNTMRSSLKV